MFKFSRIDPETGKPVEVSAEEFTEVSELVFPTYEQIVEMGSAELRSHPVFLALRAGDSVGKVPLTVRKEIQKLIAANDGGRGLSDKTIGAILMYAEVSNEKLNLTTAIEEGIARLKDLQVKSKAVALYLALTVKETHLRDGIEDFEG